MAVSCVSIRKSQPHQRPANAGVQKLDEVGSRHRSGILCETSVGRMKQMLMVIRDWLRGDR